MAIMSTTLKLIHIGAAIIFPGNIITSLFWHAHAVHARNPKLIAHAMSGIIRGDRWFTIPAVTMRVTVGIVMAVMGKMPLLRTGWIMWSLVALRVSGIVFAWRVAPLQRAPLNMAQADEAGAFSDRQYQALARRWEFWGAAALLTAIAALVLMGIKPAL